MIYEGLTSAVVSLPFGTSEAMKYVFSVTCIKRATANKKCNSGFFLSTDFVPRISDLFPALRTEKELCCQAHFNLNLITSTSKALRDA